VFVRDLGENIYLNDHRSNNNNFYNSTSIPKNIKKCLIKYILKIYLSKKETNSNINLYQT
jgi:hypothetical protein